MAAGRSQDSSMLYAVIVFVALFLASTTVAVVFYLKFSDYQKTVQDTQRDIENLANTKEARGVSTLVGSKLPHKSVVGTLLARFDELSAMITGKAGEEGSAEARLEAAKQARNAVVAQIGEIVGSDANSAGLLRDIELLKGKYDEAVTQQAAVAGKLAELEKTFDESKKASIEHEKDLAATLTRLQADANSATRSYEGLKEAMKSGSDQQIAALASKLDQADQALKTAQQELRMTQAKLNSAENRVEGLQSQLESIMPKPENMTTALKPDGRIISVDDSTRTVIVNLGQNDHVYRGLTFAVYDKSMPIPRDGKGKADIEVFDVRKEVSVARITASDKRDPIMADDVIANLIWKAGAVQEFAVAGDFAFAEGISSIEDLIKKWGGTVTETVSIKTNYVVLGTSPKVPAKPSVEEMAADPRAKDRYESALSRAGRYNEIVSQAKTLSIPVFSLERFLDFIGYAGNNGNHK